MEDQQNILDKLTNIEKSVKEIKGKYQNLIDENEFISFFNIISIISITLIISYNLNANEADSILKNFIFWSAIISKIILFILAINYIYKIEFIRYFYELKLTKTVTLFFFSAVIIFCNSKASSTINDIFEVSASDLPYSLTLTTLLYTINYISNILLIVGIIFSFTLIINRILKHISDKDIKPDQSWWTIFVFIFISTVTSGLLFKEFSESSIKYKSYQLAIQMDFNKKYYCRNIPYGFSVAFIGTNQNRVVVNTYQDSLSPMTFEEFLMRLPPDKKDINAEKKFPVIKCDI
ncbi:hypothetical protein [Acinetobacter modestus]|uniref:hypothetical protein n=1 Tax=Acinetobacter modestus TaxID=1776740 RepID=UPI00320AFDC7